MDQPHGPAAQPALTRSWAVLDRAGPQILAAAVRGKYRWFGSV